jgi:hypothetical protein
MLRQENKRFRLDQKCSGLAPADGRCWGDYKEDFLNGKLLEFGNWVIEDLRNQERLFTKSKSHHGGTRMTLIYKLKNGP